MKNNSEYYENIIELLKQALEFYGDENNYVERPTLTTAMDSLISVDNGSQARSALKLINEINISYDNIQKEYNDLMNDLPHKEDERLYRSWQDLIKELKKD